MKALKEKFLAFAAAVAFAEEGDRETAKYLINRSDREKQRAALQNQNANRRRTRSMKA